MVSWRKICIVFRYVGKNKLESQKIWVINQYKIKNSPRMSSKLQKSFIYVVKLKCFEIIPSNFLLYEIIKLFKKVCFWLEQQSIKTNLHE